MNRPWNIVGVFCEDIREEKTGHTLIGILPDNLSVPEVPGAIPKLGIYVRCHVETHANVGPISLKLKFADGEIVKLADFSEAKVKATQEDARNKGAPLAGFVLLAVAVMVQIRTTGRILAIVEIGKEEVLAAALNIQIPPTTT